MPSHLGLVVMYLSLSLRMELWQPSAIGCSIFNILPQLPPWSETLRSLVVDSM